MKKILSLFCVLALTAALLAGCASNTADSNAGAGADNNASAAQEPENRHLQKQMML